MKKDFVSVFNKDIAIDEYELDNLLDKNIEVKENEFPTILIDREDDTNKYININNNSNFTLNENIIEENIVTENNIINTIENNETENTIIENKINDLNEAYTEEENNLYNEAKNNISLTEDDLSDIENVEEFNLEDAVFGSKDNDIYKNNSEKSNMEEIDLMEEDNLKKEDEILEYEDKEVIVPSVDNVDYIDESDYIKSINSNNEVIELSGNELDLITKDKDINEDRENITVSDDNMRKDNFVLEEQIIENETAHIDDIENNKEKEEEEKTNYYINKFKKLHDEYVKSIEENKETENNKANNETEIKEEITENKNIENIETEKVENTEEVNKIETPIIEEPEEIKEELETNETESTENTTEEIKEENDLETTDKLIEEDKTNYYINKFKKMHDEYIKSIEENKETENNKANNEIEIKEEITENKNIENTEEEKLENVETEKVENNIGELNKIESPIIEEPEEIKEELETNEAETIENATEDNNEEDKTNYYINKFKKMHDEYVKSIEENKESENNKSNNETEIKEENTEIEKVENIEELNKIETPIIEEPEEIKEELETNETETIENTTEKIKEEDKTNYYINKFKKMHDEYVKSIEENKENENNKSNNETEIKEEITENKNIENTEEEKIENVESERVENIEEVNKIETPIIEEPEEIKEELETEAAENITKDIKSLDNSEITDKLSIEEEEMYKAYLGDDANLIEEVEDIIPEETEEKEEAPLINTLEITDILSAEEEEMYKAYLGDNANSIEEIEDLIPKENEEINIELEIAKNELKKKEETLSKLEIIGELSAEEESIFDDILQQNKNRYYEDDINNADIILKELNLDEIEEINESDFNILENFILGKEPEEGIELISINNENDSNKNDDNQIKSIENFDSIDSEELLNAKETKMPEEKELKIEEQNIDLNAKVDEEFSLNKDDSILTNEKINQKENGKEDFDGEITQMDLDLAEKLFETGDQKNNEDYGPKHDLLLSENDVVKFRKLFSYFKIIVDKLPKESLNDFSKTEFYDTYSSLFRKFGE